MQSKFLLNIFLKRDYFNCYKIIGKSEIYNGRNFLEKIKQKELFTEIQLLGRFEIQPRIGRMKKG